MGTHHINGILYFTPFSSLIYHVEKFRSIKHMLINWREDTHISLLMVKTLVSTKDTYFFKVRYDFWNISATDNPYFGINNRVWPLLLLKNWCTVKFEFVTTFINFRLNFCNYLSSSSRYIFRRDHSNIHWDRNFSCDLVH